MKHGRIPLHRHQSLTLNLWDLGQTLRTAALENEPVGCVCGAAAVGLISLIASQVYLWVQIQNLNLLFIVPVILVSTIWGPRPGVLTTALSVLAFDYFATQTKQTIYDAEYWISIAMLLAVSLGVIFLVEKLRQERQRADSAAARQRHLLTQLKRVHYVASQVSSQVDLSVVLDHILRLVAEAVGSDKNSIFLIDEEAGELVRGATRGLPDPFAQELKRIHPGPNAACCGRVVHFKRVIIVEDTRTDPFWQPYLTRSEEAGLRAVWSVPLVGKRGKVLGTFATYHAEPYYPTLEQVELASIYAKHAAVAIENAKLLDQVVQAQARAEAVLASSADGIMVVDDGRRVVSVNPALEKLSGYQAQELLGKPCHHLLETCNEEGTNLCDVVCPFAGNPQQRGTVFDTTMATKSGRKVWVGLTCGAIQDKQHPSGAVYIIRDITELKEVERLKDEFFSIASHELRTPVTSLKGYAQTILRRRSMGLSDVDSESRALKAIDKQSDRMVALINELLEVSRISLGRLEFHYETVDLPGLVEETIAQLAVTSEKHHLSLQSPGEVLVDADPARLEQVLLNLLTNAIKYSPKGGGVAVAISRRDRTALVTVRDEGIGIPAERQPRLFQRFYRAHAETHRDYGGMGLGLYISHEIITRHGGELWVQSEDGKGSVFGFSLPLAQREGKAGANVGFSDQFQSADYPAS